MNLQMDWRAWIRSPQGIVWLAFGLVTFGVMAQTGLFTTWTEREEYGHGLMVLGVLAYLVGQRWDRYVPHSPGNAAVSVALAVVAWIFVILGEASGISLIGFYGVWLFGVAAVWAAGGYRYFRQWLVPFLIVALLFPLPNPLGPLLTAELQLVSSKVGVWLIRLFGGSVFLEGNVLDMSGTRLLVAEACAGLRYLFPLMSLGAIAGFALRIPLWMRWTVFLVTIPITIFMNSFRIAATGLLVEAGGVAHTEGFLHFFEGWVVFIVASILLLGVIWVLVRLLPGKRSIVELMAPQAGAPSEASVNPGSRYRLPGKVISVITGLMFLAAASAAVLSARADRKPERSTLNDFPARIGEWTAKIDRLPVMTEEVAGASEYYFADFTADSGGMVNAYVAYYESQRQGRIPHSPKVCIPGGGWVIESEDAVAIQDGLGARQEVNRLVIALGGRRIIAYYWLKQGPRVYRNETLARLDLVRLSLLENRTDGALVRLTTELEKGEGLDAGNARMQRFAAEFVGRIPAYVPD